MRDGDMAVKRRIGKAHSTRSAGGCVEYDMHFADKKCAGEGNSREESPLVNGQRGICRPPTRATRSLLYSRCRLDWQEQEQNTCVQIQPDTSTVSLDLAF